MSWEAGTEYLIKYREERLKQLNNEEAMRWFASEVEEFTELIDDTFDFTEEADAWESKYQSKDKILPISAESMKVAFLAGCIRDLRILYACGGDNRYRTSIDASRMAFMEANVMRMKTVQLKDIIKARENG